MALFESEEERAALAAVPAAANIDDLRFFARVAPYFTGRWVRITRNLLLLLPTVRTVILRYRFSHQVCTLGLG